MYLCKTKNTEDMVKVSCIYYFSCALWIKSVFFLIAYYIWEAANPAKKHSYFKVKIALQLDTHPKVFLMVKLNWK